MNMQLFELETQKSYIDIEKIKSVLQNNKAVRDWAYILHDKDVDDDGNVKTPHYHVAVRLHYPQDSKHIAKWFEVQENYIERVKGKWSDMLKYLIHENAPMKYQYEVSEVVSNFDWVKDKNTNEDWRKQEIIKSIENGDIRRYNLYEKVTANEYDKYKKAITNAFEYRALQIRGKNRQMEVIYIHGDSQTGKTTYAKMIADEKRYSVYISSGTNDIMSDYLGEECIILDDLRASSVGLTDLLKMLDNHTASTVKSRYVNKILECKLIIITTTMEIEEFFKHVFENDKESVIQLQRRCSTVIRMEKEFMYAKVWNDRKREYTDEVRIINPVDFDKDFDEWSDEKRLEKLNDLLGSTVEMSQFIQKGIEEYKVRKKL